MFVVLNDDFLPAETAAVSVGDRGLILGDGLFETIAARDGGLEFLDQHLDRLARARQAFNLNAGVTPDRIAELAAALIEKNGLSDARVRVTLTRGPHPSGMSLHPASPTLLITAAPLPPPRTGGLTLATADIRFSAHNPIFFHKTLNRLPHLWARTEAERAGADEALILDEPGNVACASTANLFVVQRGLLFTPPLTAPILPGITRGRVIAVARAEGMATREDFFAPIMLLGAEEIFLTNSIIGVAAVSKIDGRPVSNGRPGPVTLRLQKLLENN